MIIAVQPFLNEVDLIKIKCETLKGIVDLFVVAESPVTFTGINKPMHFKENALMFSEYPMLHVDLSEVEETPAMKESPWNREYIQRMAVLDAVKKIDPEIVLWGDADETPKPEVVEIFKKSGHPVMNLELDMLLYYFNREDNVKWRYQRIAKWNGGIAARGDFSLPMIQNAGWHFEYFGEKQRLLDKINSTSHAIDEGGRSFYQAVWRGGQPGLERTSDYPIEKLPEYVQSNRKRFPQYFL